MSFVIAVPEMIAVVSADFAVASAQSVLIDAHGALLKSVLNALDDGRIGSDAAASLVHHIGNVALAVADRKTGSAFEAIQTFVDEVNRQQAMLPTELIRELLDGAESARRELSRR